MKTLFKLLIISSTAGILFTSCAGSYYVTERPVDPYYVRPVAPYAGAVWIPGEWAWNGGRYVYVNGYYARPRPGRIWVRGYWHPSGRGYMWHRGHWR